jgi:hypothetical protein
MKKLLFAAAALMAASISSFAANVSFTGSFGPTTTTFQTNTPLSKFDPALGTLTSIMFSITGTSNGSVAVTNTSGFDDFYNVNIATTLRLRTPANVILTQVVPTFNDPSFFVANNTTGTDSGFSPPLTNSSTITSGFAAYIGPSGAPGTVNFNVFGTGASTASGATPNSVSSTTSAFGTDSITYNYTAPTGTPEPATMGLLGSALLGLGFLKFRTKKI